MSEAPRLMALAVDCTNADAPPNLPKDQFRISHYLVLTGIPHKLLKGHYE
ncbi:hypothetical protein ACU8KH_03293 [Lachancea thermotolerans]